MKTPICPICKERIYAGDRIAVNFRADPFGAGPHIFPGPCHYQCSQEWQAAQSMVETRQIVCGLCGCLTTIIVNENNVPYGDVNCVKCKALLYRASHPYVALHPARVTATASGLRLREPIPNSTHARDMLKRGLITYREMMGLGLVDSSEVSVEATDHDVRYLPDGWRWLEVGEQVKEGDVWFDDMPVKVRGKCSNFPTIRRLIDRHSQPEPLPIYLDVKSKRLITLD